MRLKCREYIGFIKQKTVENQSINNGYCTEGGT